MAICPVCAAESSAEARICSRCGAPLGRGALPPTITEDPNAEDGTASAERFLPGQVLAGRYRIVALQGAGGMGEVYRADDLTLGQPVALKFLPRTLAADAERLEQFRTEVRSARQVSHPNVCRVHDIGDHQGQPFLIMEFIDGEDLSGLLKRVGRLSEEKAIEAARQLCAALVAVHDQGLLHRDLKPANVMLDGRGKVRLTDFGVAVLAGEARDIGTGTPAYQAPEVLAGREVSVASDLFALGLVLYEIFTGRKAYSAATRGELMKAYESGPPSKPSSHATAIDPGVERIILRCLAANPQNRPRSAVEVLAALPGGDALQAALAAGQTPSPTLVADSGETGHLPIRAGIALLTTILAGLVLFAGLTDQAGLHRRVPLRNPQYLHSKARDLLEQLGYPHTPADHAEGLIVDHAARQRALEREPSAEAWRGLATGRPAILVYWYRHAPGRIVHRLSPNDISGYGIAGMPTLSEPPLAPGEVSVVLDGLGHLLELHALPARKPVADAIALVEWDPIFRAAGLDRSLFHEVLPRRDPGLYVTERSAWEGEDPQRPGYPLRIEGAAREGLPVYFWVGDAEQENVPDRTTVSDVPADVGTQIAEYAYAGIRVLALSIGVWLAWYNLRRGLANPLGALWIAVVYAVAYLVMWAFMAHHATTLANEWAIVAVVVGGVLLNALALWVIYLALEPSVRRKKPHWVIGWNRLLAGRWRDPLVGRDVLIGCLLGVLWAVTRPVQSTLLPEVLGQPFAPYTVWLPTLIVGPIGPIISYIWWALMFSLLTFFLLMLVYLATGRLSVAVALWGLVKLLQWSPGFSSHELGASVILSGVLVALWMLALLRYGLLTFVTFGFVRDILTDLPVTLDLQAWYAPAGLSVVAVVLGLAVYGFAISTSGQRLLQEETPAQPTPR